MRNRTVIEQQEMNEQFNSTIYRGDGTCSGAREQKRAMEISANKS
jgi:hypothetical protein